MSAYSDAELERIEEQRGRIYARRTRALVDIGQRHLSEWGVGR
jgi:hypothetical protein